MLFSISAFFTTLPSPIEVKGPMYAFSIVTSFAIDIGPLRIEFFTTEPFPISMFPSNLLSLTFPSHLSKHSLSSISLLAKMISSGAPVSFHHPVTSDAVNVYPFSINQLFITGG